MRPAFRISGLDPQIQGQWGSSSRERPLAGTRPGPIRRPPRFAPFRRTGRPRQDAHPVQTVGEGPPGPGAAQKVLGPMPVGAIPVERCQQDARARLTMLVTAPSRTSSKDSKHKDVLKPAATKPMRRMSTGPGPFWGKRPSRPQGKQGTSTWERRRVGCNRCQPRSWPTHQLPRLRTNYRR